MGELALFLLGRGFNVLSVEPDPAAAECLRRNLTAHAPPTRVWLHEDLAGAETALDRLTLERVGPAPIAAIALDLKTAPPLGGAHRVFSNCLWVGVCATGVDSGAVDACRARLAAAGLSLRSADADRPALILGRRVLGRRVLGRRVLGRRGAG